MKKLAQQIFGQSQKGNPGSDISKEPEEAQREGKEESFISGLP